MAKKEYTVHFTSCYVESTPEQLLLRERALDILANIYRDILREKREAKEKMGSTQQGAPRASNDTSCFMGLPAGNGALAGSSPPPTA